ncbi:meiosis regulator and mRNA stability factor 1 isoform X2 [Drosophila obscura]|uniref:meiosis regulator and mRNA stability factor 1 isoform X2 n=1 Tax=Drosophila obscura TaxID=7282 RepID=UPI001BB0F50B|nr:meiosis regulator and mRNA stability factor 1 isoform X2 [Drosophila obscura]
MGERLYSWPCDRAGKLPTAYYAPAQTQSQPQIYQQQAVSLPSGVLCADFSNSGVGLAGGLRYYNSNGLAGYMQPPGMLPGKYASIPTQLEVCQHAHINGSASCFNRSRYMPYNHNRSCAAAAAVAAVPGHPLLHNHQQQQQTYQPYDSIYQTNSMCPLSLPMASSAAPPPISASASSATDHTSVVANSISGTDFGYASSLIDTMAPSMVGPRSRALASTVAPSGSSSNGEGSGQTYATITDPSDAVTLQITNLDYSLDESSLRNFLMNQLKPITPVVSLIFEGSSYAKVTVPDLYFAKQVVSNLHRKKIGHKRMLVSYTRDSSLTEVNTLRCQVAGLLKDVPYYTLPMYKFRELFQSRFKTSISVLDLYKMQDICTINSDNNEDKFISLQPELVNTLESSPLMEGLQHSVPYCTVHFKKEQHKGWAEQDIEPLPNVFMTISEIQKLIYPLLKHHPGDIPVATLLHCIEDQLKVSIMANESGVNLEHLVCCVQGIQIQVNNFGIKILGWLELNKEMASSIGAISCSSNLSSLNGSDRSNVSGGSYFKNSVADPLYQISREVIELVKMSPKSTMKFNRFIPAYHNHFGKQCRVADYGYTKLIELFEALSSVVQIMGDGENRQITLTHRTQIRRFTSDLLRILRAHGNNSVLLSQLPGIFAQTQSRNFDVTDYGVCDIVDILDGLVNSNIVVLSSVQQGKDILISMPKRKQTNSELEKTCVFAGEMVELFQNSLQYTILFQKFVRSYHYHFAYQCRLSDYGFLKLADLMDAINGVVEMELTGDEDKKILLSPKVARRVFAEQCEDLIRNVTGNSTNCMKLEQVLKLHKKKYGYQMQPQTLGVSDITTAIEQLPYVEVQHKDQDTWLICHNDDLEFRQLCYRACKHILQRESAAPSATSIPKGAVESVSSSASPALEPLPKAQFISEFNAKHTIQLTETALHAMRHTIEIYDENDQQCVRPTSFMRFLMSIVRMLEQRPSMYLYEIKSGLDCGLSTTFEFGFPNLYSVVAAHEDLFTINKGPTQERSDVSLNVNCALRLSSGVSHQHLFGSLKLPYAKHKAQRTYRTPLGEHNRPPPAQAPPPHKTRAIANEYANSVSSTSNASFKPQVNSFQNYQEQYTTTTKCSPPSANSSLLNSFGSSAGNLSLYNSCCNKENSLNSSLQLFNSSFNSSGDLNVSLGAGDLTNITSSTIMPGTLHAHSSGKLWHRRQASFYPQQMQPPLQPSVMQHSVNASGDLYDLVSYTVAPIGSIFESANPDTHPAEKLPYWIDPIWSNQSEQKQPNQNVLNIRLPELKSLNVLPMLLSPYTISKNENMKRQLFNFDNHDRKIA